MNTTQLETSSDAIASPRHKDILIFTIVAWMTLSMATWFLYELVHAPAYNNSTHRWKIEDTLDQQAGRHQFWYEYNHHPSFTGEDDEQFGSKGALLTFILAGFCFLFARLLVPNHSETKTVKASPFFFILLSIPIIVTLCKVEFIIWYYFQ